MPSFAIEKPLRYQNVKRPFHCHSAAIEFFSQRNFVRNRLINWVFPLYNPLSNLQTNGFILRHTEPPCKKRYTIVYKNMVKFTYYFLKKDGQTQPSVKIHYSMKLI